MKLCLEKKYKENLERYIGRKLNIIENEDNVEIISDVEIQYILKKDGNNHYCLYLVERNHLNKLEEYKSEREMQRKFAICMKGIFDKNIDYSDEESIGNQNDLKLIDKLMESYVGKNYYSINNPEINKINLEQKYNDLYNIYFLKESGDKIYIEYEEKAPFIFERFYNEALFLKVTLERINEYEIVFNDKINKEDMYNILSY